MNQILSFRQYVEEQSSNGSKHYTIYCDLDGVLANFDKSAKEIIGPDYHELYKANESEFWHRLAPPKTKNFFGSLEWQPGGEQLWNFIKSYHPTILTGIGNAWGPPQKRQWAASKLGNNVPVIVTRSSKKYQHAGPNKILIDDRSDIIRRWKQHGGIGIHHKTAATTIEKLKSLGLGNR